MHVEEREDREKNAPHGENLLSFDHSHHKSRVVKKKMMCPRSSEGFAGRSFYRFYYPARRFPSASPPATLLHTGNPSQLYFFSCLVGLKLSWVAEAPKTRVKRPPSSVRSRSSTSIARYVLYEVCWRRLTLDFSTGVSSRQKKADVSGITDQVAFGHTRERTQALQLSCWKRVHSCACICMREGCVQTSRRTFHSRVGVVLVWCCAA